MNEPTEKHLLGAAHVDQLLKVLADADIARSTPVVTESASGSIADLLADSIARFSLEQELEFTALAYCRWLPPQTEWRNRFNARFSFDDVARKLCGQPLGTGACNGIHGLQAIAQMLAVDKLHPLLSDSSISQIEGHLRECTLCLEANELPSGGWGDAWSGVAGPLPDGEQVWSPRFTVISSTGHHLEWIAIAPAELRPATPIVRRAIQALVREVAGMSESDRSNFKHFLPVSHAARALCQLRGESAIRLWQGLAPTTTNGGAK